MRIISPIFIKQASCHLSKVLLRMLNMEASIKRIAVCQMTSSSDKVANLKVISMLVKQAAVANVKMVFFPEACDYLCDNKKDLVSYAEPVLDGNTVNNYRKLAADNGMWLSMGGVHEKDPSESGKVYNTHLLIDDSGSIVQSYRKLHLFDVEIPKMNIRLMESDTALAGSHIITPVKSPVGNIGLSICYDLRFPELSTQLASMGAEILTYPSAFTHSTGEAHWYVLLRARAIENQCFVVAAAQAGQHNAKRRSYGHALVVDPWGEVLADCGEESPSVAVVEIDLGKLKRIRREMPVFKHRRSDIYSLYPLSLRAELPPEHGAAPPPQTEPCARPHYAGPAHAFGQITVPDSCVFFESALTFAFVNLRCVVPGHVLVAPIRCVRRNEDLTTEEAADFYSSVVTVQKLMERVHKVTSSTITVQDGKEAGQTIWHLHCHVMPRRPKDFRDSDLIYLELAKHDRQTANAPLKPPRSLEEMTQEAAMLRRELASMRQDSIS